MNKLLYGRLTSEADAFLIKFNSSVTFDYRLSGYDIEASIAHVCMLHKVKLLTPTEKDIIVTGLRQIQQEISHNIFHWKLSLEDVHMNIENRLIELVGEIGKKIHMGRSRNDQVATDLRLFIRTSIDSLLQHCNVLLKTLLDLAEREADTIMPGMTHLQIAQPVTFGHHIMAWVAMLERDCLRIHDCRKRTNIMPLGAAALAGTTFNIDRNYVAKKLKFDGLCENSIDAVSDRDFAIEFCAVASVLMMHFSRWSEELVLWSSAQFRFIDLPDSLCTGSSIMPQKKNPDIPELVRGKTGRVYGSLMNLLTVMKAQPLAYNKDNQEDKEAIFDTVDTVNDCIQAMILVVTNLKARKAELLRATQNGFATATDFADYLVRRGVAFRDAHTIVGLIVAQAVTRNLELKDFSLEELQSFHKAIDADVFDTLIEAKSVKARVHLGGTAPQAVRQAIINSRKKLGII